MDWKVVAAAPLVIENQLPSRAPTSSGRPPRSALYTKPIRIVACASWLCSLYDRGCLQSCTLSVPLASLCCLAWDDCMS